MTKKEYLLLEEKTSDAFVHAETLLTLTREFDNCYFADLDLSTLKFDAIHRPMVIAAYISCIRDLASQVYTDLQVIQKPREFIEQHEHFIQQANEYLKAAETV